MAGRLITVIPKTTFDFTSGMIATAGESALIPVGEIIDVTAYTNIGLAVRIHENSLSEDAFISVFLLGDGFLDVSNVAFQAVGPVLTLVQIGASDSAPAVRFSRSYVDGAYAVVAVQAVTAAEDETVRATISVDVFFQNGDPVEVDASRAVRGQQQFLAPRAVDRRPPPVPPPLRPLIMDPCRLLGGSHE